MTEKHDVSRHRRAAVVLLAAGAAGCVAMESQNDPGRVLPARPEQRFTDRAIRADWAAMEALRARIGAARARAVPVYVVDRAEAQLDFAAEEYEENDLTGVVEGLLDDALRLVSMHESAHAGPKDLSVPKLPGVVRVRDDLWREVDRIKADPALLDCVGRETARLEVGLVALGHEQYEVDVGLNDADHAKPYELLVASLADALQRATWRCTPADPRPKQPAGAASAPAPDESRRPPAAVERVESQILGAHTLFRFDRWAEDDMLAEGRASLDAFAARRSGDLAAWRSMIVTGHTDRLGGYAYNLQLSLRRAETVRGYLVRRGVPAARIEVHGMAFAQPVVFCRDERGDRLKACLQPNRRVEIEVLR